MVLRFSRRSARCVPSACAAADAPFGGRSSPHRSSTRRHQRNGTTLVAAAHCAGAEPPHGPRSSVPRARGPASHGLRRRPQPRPARPRRARGHGRGASGQRPAELHAGRPGRHRSQGSARAGARGAADQRPRVPAQQAHHGQPRAGRPAEGVGPLRPADRARHPRRQRPDRRGAARAASSSPASSRSAASCARCAARWRWRLALQRSARRRRARTLVLPHASADEAALGRRPRGPRRARTCSMSCARCCPARPADARGAARCRGRAAAAPRRRCPTCATSRARPAPSARSRSPRPGGHSLLMVGPPGTGKSMLAQRFAGLLPALTHDEALESAAILSLAGALRRRPLGPARAARAASHARRRPRWSAAARRRGPARSRSPTTACCSSTSCPSSRAPRSRPCASRSRPAASSISRAARQAEFPARFQLVAAMNPCPCGHLGSRAAAPAAARPTRCCATRARISGPLLDRIDLQVEVPAVAADTLAAAPDGEPSARDRERVARRAARARSRARAARNAALAGDALDRHCALDARASRFLQAAARGSAGRRAAFTACCASPARSPTWPASAEIDDRPSAEAIQYRRVLQTH